MALDLAKFTFDSSGNIRQVSAFVPGTDARFTTLELHAALQDLADNATPSGDDLVSILGTNPSELAGKRNASRPMALTLLPNFNLNDATAQWFKFGSVEQNSGADLYTGLKVIGSLVASSPIYILQNLAKITKYWADADVNTAFQILVKAKASGTLIDSGNITVYSRKYGQTYSHFDVNLAAGGEQAAALSTAIDANVDTGVMTPAIAAGYFSTAIGGTATPGTQKITLAYGDTTQNLGGGQGALLHKGTITLNLQRGAGLPLPCSSGASLRGERRGAVRFVRRWQVVCCSGLVANRRDGGGLEELSTDLAYGRHRDTADEHRD